MLVCADEVCFENDPAQPFFTGNCLNTKAILKNHLKKESKKEYFQTYDKKWVAFLGDST